MEMRRTISLSHRLASLPITPGQSALENRLVSVGRAFSHRREMKVDSMVFEVEEEAWGCVVAETLDEVGSTAVVVCPGEIGRGRNRIGSILRCGTREVVGARVVMNSSQSIMTMRSRGESFLGISALLAVCDALFFFSRPHHRSTRWGQETENFPSSEPQFDIAPPAANIPVIGSMARFEISHVPSEPPPPGE